MNIREARKLRHTTQQELADAIGVTSSLISRYEKLDIIPSTERLQAIAECLSVPLEWLQESHQERRRLQNSQLGNFTDDLAYDRYVVQENSQLEEALLHRCKGHCELCKQPAPFNRPNGLPYLEMHHLVPLINGGKADLSNTVYLCSNCHTKLHRINDEADLEKLRTVTSQEK